MDNGQRRDGAIKDVGARRSTGLPRDRISTRRAWCSAAAAPAAGSRSRRASCYNDRIRGVIEGAGMTDLVDVSSSRRAPARQDNRRGEYGDERDPQMREFLQLDLAGDHAR